MSLIGSGCNQSPDNQSPDTARVGFLTAAADQAGLGQAGGRQFYSFLCSLVKLCYCFSRESVLQQGVMWNQVQPAVAALDCIQLEGCREGEGPTFTLDALPSVFIIGRCCLLWADILSAQGEVGELALQESQQLRLLCFLSGYLTLLCEAVDAWLLTRSAQLSAAGHPIRTLKAGCSSCGRQKRQQRQHSQHSQQRGYLLLLLTMRHLCRSCEP